MSRWRQLQTWKGTLLLVYIVAGVYEILDSFYWVSAGINPLGSWPNIRFQLLQWVPLLIAAAGGIALLRRSRIDIYLWACTLCWLGIALIELFSYTTAPRPASYRVFPVLVMLPMSAVTLGLLLKRRGQSSVA